MRLLTVREYESGQRFDRYLQHYLKEAPRGFLYKMLRKKNITLNGKRAEGDEKLEAGDEIRLFLSEETLEKFTGNSSGGSGMADSPGGDAVSPGSPEKRALRPEQKLPPILYEDSDVIFFNKPAGMLSQKAGPEDISLCELLTGHMLSDGSLTRDSLMTFRPGVCNRLDRNTSGVVAAGKSSRGLRCLSELIRDRQVGKYYLGIVSGLIFGTETLDGYLSKDERTNSVTVKHTPPGDRIITSYRPLARGSGCTLLEIRLITGKSHQIRAHLASIGHPVLGDAKYGSARRNQQLRDEFGLPLRQQLLHAWKMHFPAECGELPQLADRWITAPPPRRFREAQQALRLDIRLTDVRDE